MNLDRDTILKFLDEKLPYLKESFNITRIGLFGSFARNEPSEESDIDLIVEFKKDTPDLYDIKYNLRQYLKGELHRDVDICREKYIKPFAREIIRKETIYVE